MASEYKKYYYINIYNVLDHKICCPFSDLNLFQKSFQFYSILKPLKLYSNSNNKNE